MKVVFYFEKLRSQKYLMRPTKVDDPVSTLCVGRNAFFDALRRGFFFSSFVVLIAVDVRPHISLTKRRMPKWGIALGSLRGDLQKGVLARGRGIHRLPAECGAGLYINEMGRDAERRKRHSHAESVGTSF